MGLGVSFGKAGCAARCGASGKQANAADLPPMPTEGQARGTVMA